MSELSGWLLDLYPTRRGAALWLLGEDGIRRRLEQPFPITFYAAGTRRRLDDLEHELVSRPEPPVLARCQRRDLFQPGPIPLLSICTADAAGQPELFSSLAAAFPDLTFYDADIPITLRHAAVHQTFPLCRCTLQVGVENSVTALGVHDSPWDLDPPPAPLRILQAGPDCPPRHAAPEAIILRYGGRSVRLPLAQPRPLLVNFAAILRQFDPDLILTDWGDSWLLPLLLELSEQHHVPLPLNRDPEQAIDYHREHSYFTYGQIIFRDQQLHLFGRWHIDIQNAMLYHDYDLEGVLELGRVTHLPVQTVARTSPGSGISAMQMVEALSSGVLVPWHKQQAEQAKTAAQLLRSDQGGLIYQPITGLHRDVAELDFVSLYPSIMVHFNISPEIPARPPSGSTSEMEQGAEDGLIPRTLRPLLEKRLALKRRLARFPTWDTRRTLYKARSSAHKWLMVTCFGYLGYKNARFGRIEAHESVTAHGREILLTAKEAAEELGFEVLHLYVDGLWVRKPGCREPADFEALMDAITAHTGLPIALEGVYRWLVFPPSRLDERIPVPNRYFGAFQDGSLKLRGIEARRRDTARWIGRVQNELLEQWAQASGPQDLPGCLPANLELLRREIARLRAGRIPLSDLVVSQKVSRALDAYRTPSPAARAAAQLAAEGKSTRPGQRVEFIFTLGEPGVHAWDLANPPNRASIDLPRYITLLLRAASSVTQAIGVSEAMLARMLNGSLATPLFDLSTYQRVKPSRASF